MDSLIAYQIKKGDNFFYSSDIIGLTCDNLFRVKNQVSNIYKEVGNFVLNASKNMHSFNTKIKPYVDYYYKISTIQAEKCFIHDIVISSRDDIIRAFERIVEITQNDNILYEEITSAIENVMNLRKSIDDIINIIDDIDIYYLNLMVVSVRAGKEGAVLTKLSEEMGKLSITTSSITEKYIDMINKLKSFSKDFQLIRNDIEFRLQEYKEFMCDEIENEFSTLVNDLNIQSKEVNTKIMRFQDLKQIFDEIIMRLQIDDMQLEDIYMQNIDKVIFMMNAVLENSGELSKLLPQETEKYRKFMEYIVCEKINTIMKDTNEVQKGFRDFIGHSSNIINDLFSEAGLMIDIQHENNKYNVYEKSHQTVKNIDIMLKNGIEEIINTKKEIYNFFKNIMEIIFQIREVFPEINNVLKKLEVLNMMTKMEIARNKSIESEFKDSLFEIFDRPKIIKAMVEKTEEVYFSLRKDIEMCVPKFRETISHQEKDLHSAIEFLQQVTVKINESNKYHNNITTEIKKHLTDLDDFINKQKTEFKKLKATYNMVDEVYALLSESKCSKDELSREEIISDKSCYEVFKKYLIEDIPTGEYKKLMINSFFNEYLELQHDSNIVYFNANNNNDDICLTLS